MNVQFDDDFVFSGSLYVTNLSPTTAHAGLYMVDEAHRGQGVGMSRKLCA